jgi:peptide-methionine (S)-S-oxide reductase
MAETEITTLGGGCFWCLEAVYAEMAAVLSVQSGYMGGDVSNPTYEQVCTGRTGHAEVVQLRFDPSVTSYRDVLEVFFAIHDPTTPNRQGNDIGPQYRSVIFYHSEHQRREAEDLIRELTESDTWPDPIVTEVTPAGVFYEAEEYHNEYFANHPNQPYCVFTVAPKVAKFRSKFADRRKAAR